MSLDTKYRPLRFEDVLGQEGTTQVLRKFISDGKGFHQSYIFCGFHGSGKTTLGRILARALLCENPVGGDPCDRCSSCQSILNTGSSECFIEFDAATNSGKEDIKKIVETIQYDTFSGKQRIYLIDESHRLSKQALDALLKPMEDTSGSSEDKQLVCIFCTTEPERMVPTIFSRCAPAFKIRRVPIEEIAKRLAYVCEKEDVPFEQEALQIISEVTESHIRDALKTVEGVSMLGPLTKDNVWSYLHLDANRIYLQILQEIGRDLSKVLDLAESLYQMVSPVTCYERLAEVSMLAYKVGIGTSKAPNYWNGDLLEKVARFHGAFLVRFALIFSKRPGRPSLSMLLCDLAQLHHDRRGEAIVPATTRRAGGQALLVEDVSSTHGGEAPNLIEKTASCGGRVDRRNHSVVDSGGVYIEEQAIKKKGASVSNSTTPSTVSLSDARKYLRCRVAELEENERRTRST